MTFEPRGFTMCVESGIYAGALQDFTTGRYVVGSGLDADIVLKDEGIELAHLVIETHESNIFIEACADDITLNFSDRLSAGAKRKVELPATIRVSHVQLALSLHENKLSRDRTPPETKVSRNFRSRFLAVTAVIPALVGFLIFNPSADSSAERFGGGGPLVAEYSAANTSVSQSDGLSLDIASQNDRDVPQLGPAHRLAVPKLSVGIVNAAAEALREQVQKAGLLNVSVEPGAGVAMATGTIDAKAAGQWQRVQQWFDERYGGDITLVNGVSAKAERVPVSLAIEGVWRGPHPHLIIRGQKYLEGAIVEGGWSIQQITSDRVFLQRDGKLVAVQY